MQPGGVTVMTWKDHPLAIAGSSVVATAAFMIALGFTVVIPTWTERLRNENERLRSSVPEYETLKKEVDKLKGRNAELRAQLAGAQGNALFAGGSLYPLGYRKFKVGDVLSDLESAYPEDPIEWSDDWVTVNLRHGLFHGLFDHGLFDHVTYHFTERKGKKVIGFVMFHFWENGKATYDFIRAQMLSELANYKHSETYRNGIHSLEMAQPDGTLLRLDYSWILVSNPNAGLQE
jgi:hypothetical protein